MRKPIACAAAVLATVGCGGAAGTPAALDAAELDLRADKQVDRGIAGMVVSDHPVASKVGAKILKRGGNAVDAAIAIQFALNVVEPQNSGVGGGGFMMVYSADDRCVTIVDARERAAATATATMFLGADGKPIPFVTRQTLGRAVGVPGTLLAIEAAHQRWGRLALKQLIQPAIRLAEDGVSVNFVLAADIAAQKDKLLLDSTASSVFVPKGIPLVEGDVLVQPDLARTLRRIRDDGAEPLYDGEIGQALVAAVAARGGSMTATDLRDYSLTFDRPIHKRWHGVEIAAMPPPSSGGTTSLEILALIDKLHISSYGPRDVARYHILTEAMQVAFADRNTYLGDPEFVSNPVAGILDDAYLTSRAALITPNAANANIVAGVPASAPAWPASTSTFSLDDVESGTTTHFVVADADGNLVSWTSTIEQAFGTGIMVPGYGFMLNNEITDFSPTPTGPNQAAPHKRPLSSMSPTIVFDEHKPLLALGASGGSRIIVAVAQVLENYFDHELDLKDAIEEPRIFSTAFPTINWGGGSWGVGAAFGERVPATALAGLVALGHQPAATMSPRGFIGVAQAIEIDPETGVMLGAADSQREGRAIGLDHVAQGH